MTKFLFQMDDPKDFNIEEDSTYLMIKEAVSRGVKCFYNDPKWIYVDSVSYTHLTLPTILRV